MSKDMSLRDAAGIFRRKRTPWVIGMALIVASGLRVVEGNFSAWDLGVAVALIGFQPISEWVIHTTLLHWRPRRLMGITIDPLSAREHRRHHADPRQLDLVLIPMRTLVLALLAGPLWFLVLPTTALALTAITTVNAILLVYEWTHFLIHTDYRPQSAAYKIIWRHHRDHHYRNENYWFGVMSPGGDIVLRTNPSADEVPVSPTAKDLIASYAGSESAKTVKISSP